MGRRTSTALVSRWWQWFWWRNERTGSFRLFQDELDKLRLDRFGVFGVEAIQAGVMLLEAVLRPCAGSGHGSVLETNILAPFRGDM